MQLVKFIDVTFADLELIRNWRNSKHVSDYMFTNKIISKEEQVDWYSKITNSINSKYWIIKYKDVKVGVINITNIDYLNSSCNWAFYIGALEYRESGVGPQTEYMIIEKIFTELKLKKIQCEVIASNLQVLNLHKRFGFKIISNNDFFVIKNSVPTSVIKLCLCVDDWIKMRDRLKKIIFNNLN
jgi:UDP-4-amino-4,6-dideoxy-N-acetyl-beta-L-altrosamine N-acetyltransferase